jgi:hypothetical protein
MSRHSFLNDFWDEYYKSSYSIDIEVRCLERNCFALAVHCDERWVRWEVRRNIRCSELRISNAPSHNNNNNNNNNIWNLNSWFWVGQGFTEANPTIDLCNPSSYQESPNVAGHLQYQSLAKSEVIPVSYHCWCRIGMVTSDSTFRHSYGWWTATSFSSSI